MKINRRDFLRTSAATTGSISYFLPSTASASYKPEGDKIRVAMIGVANQGTNNYKSLLSQPACKIVAACDVDSGFLGTAKENIEKATKNTIVTEKDYRKILERKDVDAVLITVPDHWHAKISIDACEAGKDVYCEKPLTLVIAEGRKMVDAARKNKRILQTGSQQRSANEFRLACELVRNGHLGKISEVKVGLPKANWIDRAKMAVADSTPPAQLDYDFWIGPAPMRPYNKNRVHYLFRFFWDYSGGQMTNFGAHDLDITQWGLGMDDGGPTTIEAQAKFNKDNWFETPEWLKINYTYANGVKVTCEQAGPDGKNNIPGGVTFVGEKGSIHVQRGKITSNPGEITKEPIKDTEIHLYASKNHHANWLECISTRKLPICDVEIGHRSATVCHLGNIAIRTGRKITWDPVKEQIVGDKEANAMTNKEYRKPWKLV